MVTTIVNVDNFEQTYWSGLLFSLFEGLKEGEAFKVVSKDSFEEIKSYFISAQIQNLSLKEDKSDQMEVAKVKSTGNSCNMCGC